MKWASVTACFLMISGVLKAQEWQLSSSVNAEDPVGNSVFEK
jgi:hypothetical protein